MDLTLKIYISGYLYKGQQSVTLKRQLIRILAKIAPWVKLNCIFFASNKISRLCKLKCSLPVIKQSHLIYQVTCKDCHEFYIGLTNRCLKTRLNEHKSNENRHSLDILF